MTDEATKPLTCRLCGQTNHSTPTFMAEHDGLCGRCDVNVTFYGERWTGHEILPVAAVAPSGNPFGGQAVAQPVMPVMPVMPVAAVPQPVPDSNPRVDVGALIAAGLKPPAAPTVMQRADGVGLFYAGHVNVLFGDPESGKTWIAYAAVTEALRNGRTAAIVDADHNGAHEIINRLQILGCDPRVLSDVDRFALFEPTDADALIRTVAALHNWTPDIATYDSLGEIIPMMGARSNDPDDYSKVHRIVLSSIAELGACVLAIDHLPKDDAARARGQTGTMAKRRTVNGVTLHVSVVDAYAPGRGGSSSLTIYKDRPGGLRGNSPQAHSGKHPAAGRFVMEPQPDGGVTFRVTVPTISDSAERVAARADDIAALDALPDPKPTTVRDVKKALNIGQDRASAALHEWKRLQERAGDDDDDDDL
jgi:KaiC/GvpD/RAD55 family RecA-like ATPase